jgi:hypothetical protein
MENRPYINRILISLITALSFAAMSLSGIAAFIVPQGRVAFWTNWTFLGLSKTQWGNIHITTSVLFLIAGIWHTCYNWTPLMQYLRGIPGRMTASWRDLAIASLITLFFTIGAVTKTPPLNYILNLNSWIKDSWVKSPGDDPPFGHAELLSLKGFCKKMYIDPGEALRELRQSGLNVADDNATVERIARDNGTTPARVYQVIKKLERPDAAALVAASPAVAPVVTQPTPAVMKAPAANRPAASHPARVAAEPARYTPDMVVERFEGKGIGKKNLGGICQELNLDCGRIKQKLAAQKITVKDDETVKEASGRLDMVPIELLKIILTGESVVP